MKLIHFSDTHIGFRSFDRVTSMGVNRREDDVAQTFARLIDRVIELRPDVITIAGDVFHFPRPTNNAILTAFTGFSRLVKALPETIVVISAGNHDLARAKDSASILQLLTTLGIHLADWESKRFYFPTADLSVLAVPDAPGVGRPRLDPDPRATHNVLCCHGELQGVTQGGASHRVSMSEISPDELNAPAWSYIAMGHYHQVEQLGPNAFYSGAPDFTSSNPWQEIGTPKGLIERDLETGAHTFHELAPARRYVDLERIDATDINETELDARIAAAVESLPGGLDGAVVRLRVYGITREVSHALDQKAMREYKRRALNFHFVEDRLVRVRSESVAMVRSFSTLEQRVEQELAGRKLDPDVDRAAVTALATRYLEQAKELTPAAAVVEPIAPDAEQLRRAS